MYVMAYFRTDAEALHLAASDDGLRWSLVRSGEPIFWSPVGTRTVRDPFLCRTNDGRFHLLASDGWKSDGIVHAVSDDLLTWTQAELVPVMRSVPSARNAWAPEAFWDENARCWRLIWSSSTTGETHSADWDHRIWSCATQDFVNFTPPTLFFDPGYSVIDACVVRHGHRYLMAFKDERGQNPPHHQALGQRKAIAVASADNASGPWKITSDLVTPPLTEGPAIFRQGGRWIMIFDHFIEERFGALASKDGLHWEPLAEPVEFPPGVRHASVLEIPENLGDAIRSVSL